MEANSYIERKRAEFKTYLEKIKSFGYKIRICKNLNYNYAYIINEHNVVGYCELSRFTGINLSTRHHPCEICGTGFQIEDMITLENLDSSMIERCFCIVPQWSISRYSALVKKIVIDDGSKESAMILENSVEI